MDGKDLAGFLGHRHHFPVLGRIHGNRLFTDDVFPGPQGADHDIVMDVVRGGAEDDIHLRVSQQRLQAFIGGDPMVPGELLPFFPDVIGAADAKPVDCFNQFPVPVPHTAQANNRKLKLLFLFLSHLSFLLIRRRKAAYRADCGLPASRFLFMPRTFPAAVRS